MEVQRRRGSLVSSGRGEVARELRGSEAERLVRSIEGGEGRRWGFDGEVELVGARAGGGGVLGILGRERAKGRGELVEGVLVVPLRAIDWALGLCLGRATATARWRPASTQCCVARQGRHSAKAKSGGGGRA